MSEHIRTYPGMLGLKPLFLPLIILVSETTTQRILLEKQADWLIFQGREKIEEVCKG